MANKENDLSARNPDKTTQNWAYLGILRWENIMIKVLFVCHGSILKYPEKVCKINDFMAKIGVCYITVAQNKV